MSLDDVLLKFDAAHAVEPDFMIGTWHGSELPTGHPLDGLLATSGWWGKQFIDAETVHPLLFPTRDRSALWALNPGLLPVAPLSKLPFKPRHSMAGMVAALRPLLQTAKPRARLRTTRYRGVDSATMCYDQLPINDVFRRLPDSDGGADRVIGAMDLRGSATPYFFVLQRDDSMSLREPR